MRLPWHRALHQLPAGPSLWFWNDPRIWEVNKLSELCVIDRCVHTHARTSSPSPIFFSVLGLQRPSSYLRSYPPIPHKGRAEMRVSVVWLSSSETLAKLSVLSANFTTCDKLKAVMWKRCLPLFFPFLPSPLSFHSVVYTLDFVSFPHLIYSTHCFSLYTPPVYHPPF